MQTYTDHTLLFFSDVLDNITLFYVIRKEVKQEMEAQGIEMNSDDEVDDEDSDYESGSDDESGESEMSEPDDGGDGSDSDGKRPKKKKDSDSDSSEEGDNVIKATAGLQEIRDKSGPQIDDEE